MKAHEYYNDSGFIFYTIGTSQYGQALISSLTCEWHDTMHHKCREAHRSYILMKTIVSFKTPVRTVVTVANWTFL